ncbi:hypothetical protein [Corynebacterium sp. HS2168-gen11]|uniref:hypothetical protein n=1 Tax=Corynebacterium sp. HS2168-gen11 TaxID=2974027 RepID=UPI00216B2EDF|nr:hypothetical protein [Corynebacterium sp. HS2168-gen11]MCS4535264.1 hypothetical protein [Corynebacterium sp. HS2168-gen11]
MSNPLSPADFASFCALVETPAALESIQAFEDFRYQLSLLSDGDKPDKHTTIFVDAADLAWAWLGDGTEMGFAHFASLEVLHAWDGQPRFTIWQEHYREILFAYIDQYEFQDPPFVAMIEQSGGLRH